MSMPHKTASQCQTIKNLINGYEKHMTWWMTPNPGQPYSDIYVVLEGKYLKIKPDGTPVPINQEQYMKHWALAYRAGLGIDEYHKLDAPELDRLLKLKEEGNISSETIDPDKIKTEEASGSKLNEMNEE